MITTHHSPLHHSRLTTHQTPRRVLPLAILCAFGLALLMGCGGIRRVPVSGTVTLDGKPLNGGILVFTPDLDKGNTAKISCTSAVKEGHYDLETNGITRAESGAGVPLGWYKVTLRVLDLGTKKHPQAPINVHDKYRSVEKTPLSVEVKDNPEPGVYDFKMTK